MRPPHLSVKLGRCCWLFVLEGGITVERLTLGCLALGHLALGVKGLTGWMFLCGTGRDSKTSNGL